MPALALLTAPASDATAIRLALAEPERSQPVTHDRHHAPATRIEKAILAFTMLYFAWQLGRAFGAGVL